MPTTAPTEIATPTMTWTPLPTLPPEERWERVRDLFLNNAGCRLPCWWGITPGETTWDYAQHYLAPIATDYGILGKLADVHFVVENESELGALDFLLLDGIISRIIVKPVGTQWGYQLHQLLSSYGKPGEVRLDTESTPFANYLNFNLYLYYPEQATLAHYRYQASKIGRIIRTCPQGTGFGPELTLWSFPWREFPLEYVNTRLGLGRDSPIPKLEDVTELNLDTFYEIFKVRDVSACIETPAELWP